MARVGLYIGILIVVFACVHSKKKTTKKSNSTTPHPGWVETTRYYNPNYGFKQYWPGGDWKFLGKNMNTTTQNPITTKFVKTTAPVQVCSDDCPTVYRNITEVCVVKSGERNTEKMDKYFTTSYCQYLKDSDPKCTYSSFAEIKLLFVHVGRCLQNYVQDYKLPNIVGKNKFDSVYSNKYTADIFEHAPKVRMTKFIQKFYDPVEWTKYYPGEPYKVVPFENLP